MLEGLSCLQVKLHSHFPQSGYLLLTDIPATAFSHSVRSSHLVLFSVVSRWVKYGLFFENWSNYGGFSGKEYASRDSKHLVVNGGNSKTSLRSIFGTQVKAPDFMKEIKQLISKHCCLCSPELLKRGIALARSAHITKLTNSNHALCLLPFLQLLSQLWYLLHCLHCWSFLSTLIDIWATFESPKLSIQNSGHVMSPWPLKWVIFLNWLCSFLGSMQHCLLSPPTVPKTHSPLHPSPIQCS